MPGPHVKPQEPGLARRDCAPPNGREHYSVRGAFTLPNKFAERADVVPLRALRNWAWSKRKTWRRRRHSLAKRVKRRAHSLVKRAKAFARSMTNRQPRKKQMPLLLASFLTRNLPASRERGFRPEKSFIIHARLRTANRFRWDLETIWRETLAGFEWLARDVDRDSEVSFVPNPGNIGDALINVSCYRYLTARFRKITVSSWREAPANKHVFIAGGGNLVQDLYDDMAGFLGGLDRGQQLYLFPSTVSGYEALLGQLRGRTRMLSRERVSFAHVREHLGEVDTALGHDAAFALADRLRAAFRIAIHQVPPQKTARFYRKDTEGKIGEPGDGDLMARAGGAWTDPAEAEKAVLAIVPEILACSRVYTDRLHCAILSALLDRYVVLRPNSYFKNQEVFDHSLSRFANVRFHAEALDA